MRRKNKCMIQGKWITMVIKDQEWAIWILIPMIYSEFSLEVEWVGEWAGWEEWVEWEVEVVVEVGKATVLDLADIITYILYI